MLESKSESSKTLLEYTYDKNNNLKTIQDITGKHSKYTYDKADRLKTIQDENNNIQAQYEYFGNDNIKSVTLGNGVKTEYEYDGDGNVASLVTVTSSGEVLVNYNYAYDLNGNRLSKVSSKHKNYYSYDSMNRLVNSSYDGRKESFTYDKVGNRLTKTTNDITEKYVYNVKNQLKELHHKDGINFFTYDKQGNTLKEETTSGTNSFEYNTLNQQVKAITKEGNTLVNRYDAEGLRYEIEENEKLTKFIFHNDEVLVETDESDKAISRFIRGYDVVAADVKDGRYYYSVDEQGSTEFITDVAGKVRNEYRYDVFGNVREAKENIHNRITYTGQQFDNVTNQYYLRARFYNPIIGRFTQEDSYRGDGLNLYAYCENNPVIYYDPSGYKGKANWQDCDIKLGGKVIGKVNYKTGEKLHIYIDNELIDKLGNNIKFDTSSENGIMKKIFSKFNPKIRGKMIENVIANKVMNDYIQIGDGLGGHFPVIDLANGKNVVSIKSMNIFGKSCYATDAAGNYIMNGKYHVYDEEKMFQRVKKYYDQIDDIEIKINNHTVKKQLHLEINKGSSVEKYKRVINNKVQNYIKEKNKQKKSSGKCPKLSAFFTIN